MKSTNGNACILDTFNLTTHRTRTFWQHWAWSFHCLHCHCTRWRHGGKLKLPAPMDSFDGTKKYLGSPGVPEKWSPLMSSTSWRSSHSACVVQFWKVAVWWFSAGISNVATPGSKCSRHWTLPAERHLELPSHSSPFCWNDHAKSGKHGPPPQKHDEQSPCLSLC